MIKKAKIWRKVFVWKRSSGQENSIFDISVENILPERRFVSLKVGKPENFIFFPEQNFLQNVLDM